MPVSLKRAFRWAYVMVTAYSHSRETDWILLNSKAPSEAEQSAPGAEWCTVPICFLIWLCRRTMYACFISRAFVRQLDRVLLSRDNMTTPRCKGRSMSNSFRLRQILI